MKRLIVGIVTAAVLVSMARTAMAQSKTVSSEMRTETATVESIDPRPRTVTLKKPDGTFVQTVAGRPTSSDSRRSRPAIRSTFGITRT